MLKVARASHGEKKDELEEYSTDDYGNMYFAFCKVTTHEADGGSRVSEERTYLDDSETLQKTRRTASFPAGVAPEIAAKAPAEKLAIAKSSDEARTLNNTTSEVIAALCVPERLAHDPAKDAPAEWQRVKLVQGSLSPDGHTALAIAPKKETFAWADHADSPLGGYTMEVDAAVNYLADLQTHRLLGKTLGTHFGTRARYNHHQCIFAWSPDSRIFLQLDVAKWSYVDCCIGQLRDGKLAPVQDLGAAVETRAKEFLAATKNRAYRHHAKEMVTALYQSVLQNDGTGTLQVSLEVPKSAETNARATMQVRFRLAADSRLEILGAPPVPE